MSDYTIWNKSVSDMVETVNDLMRYETSTTYQVPIWVEPKPEQLNNTVNGYNFEISYIKSLGDNNVFSTWQGKIIPKENVRCCYVEYDAHVKIGSANTDTTVHNVILIGNNMGTTSYTDAMFDVKEFGCASNYNQGAVRHDNSGRNIYPAYYGTWQFTSFESFGLNFLQTSTLNDNNLTNAVNNMICDDSTAMFNFLRAVSTAVPNSFFGGNTRTQSTGSNFFNGLWFYPIGAHAYDYTITKLPFPVFKIEDTTSIIEYLLTGNDTGSYDPFDTNPKKKSIDDFRTNYRVFLSAPSDKSDKTHFNVIAYNNEYMQNRESLTDYYALKTWHYTSEEMLSTPNVNYPQNVWDEKIIHVVNPDRPEGMHLYLQFLNVDYPSFHSTTIDLKLNGDTTRECNCYVHKVSQGTTDLVRSQITDGYRYTNTSTGEYVEVLFRQATIKDLNDEYSIIPDDEDETTGEDQTSVVGAGFRTFIIDNTKFNTINKKLWSTDWSQVFKSNTIDPIKCVIACKSIPFSATAGTNDTVIIANLDTGVQANTCNPVKSFTIGTFEMPTFNGDFTDIENLRIRCYLPYIGWIELPASECMSRRAWPDQGLLPNIKKLTFKYIVDFINGDCRCVIAVNGTERFFFDGHCDVNIPMTSDNHTNAVANAIKSGVETVLSVGAAVAGAYTGNAMAVAGGAMGAISNAADMIPTYTYSASCSPSGYINASMNTHIMIIFERPNVQKPDGYEQKFGRPCLRNLNLGSCRGYTQCSNANVSGINATPQELEQIKSQLESGVYL